MRSVYAVLAFVSAAGISACTTSTSGTGLAASTPSESVPLIPREVLFGNPDKARVRMSWDGTRISYLAPLDGVLNVWVAQASLPEKAKPVTSDKKRGIRYYGWSYTPQFLWYIQDKDGDENWHVFVVDLDKNEVRDLTPFDKVNAQVLAASPKRPKELLLGINKRDERAHDVFRVNLETGELKEIERNETNLVGFLANDDLEVVVASRFTSDGGIHIVKKSQKGWQTVLTVGVEDAMTTGPVGISPDGSIVYLQDSRERNTGALVKWNLSKNTFTELAKDERADLESALFHPTTRVPQAASFNYERRSWTFFDEDVKADFEKLGDTERGDFDVVSQTLDNRIWMVAFEPDNGPVKYFRYDRSNKEATFLFTNRPELDKQPLAKMYPVVIKARDGLNLVSYYSLPPTLDDKGRAKQPMPMVLFVHGGPWYRDRWGYDPYHQWLSNRGYAVLSVNYRSSTGFGKDFVNAGNQEWAGKSHDDLIDAAAWAVRQGVAIEDKIAIMGGSYGGYATLVGLTFTPEQFACGVDIVGPSNLVTLLENFPPYWAPIAPMLSSRLGDHKTKEGRAFLESRSPLFKADAIVRPLLIGQGANDPRVTQVESDQIVEAMKKRNIPVTYVLYKDEGHGFRRPENSKSFNAVTEAFLAKCLGGRVEPVGGDFAGANFVVPEGAEYVPGLAEALESASGSEG